VDAGERNEILAVLRERLAAVQEKSDEAHKRLAEDLRIVRDRTHDLAGKMARTEADAEYTKRMLRVLETSDPVMLSQAVDRLNATITRHDRILVGPDPEKLGGLMGTTVRLEGQVTGLVRTHRIAIGVLATIFAPPSIWAIVKLHAWFFLGKAMP